MRADSNATFIFPNIPEHLHFVLIIVLQNAQGFFPMYYAERLGKSFLFPSFYISANG
jgi:hypothetical protein